MPGSCPALTKYKEDQELRLIERMINREEIAIRLKAETEAVETVEIAIKAIALAFLPRF